MGKNDMSDDYYLMKEEDVKWEIRKALSSKSMDIQWYGDGFGIFGTSIPSLSLVKEITLLKTSASMHPYWYQNRIRRSDAEWGQKAGQGSRQSPVTHTTQVSRLRTEMKGIRTPRKNLPTGRWFG
jgi:hypothetical protein